MNIRQNPDIPLCNEMCGPETDSLETAHTGSKPDPLSGINYFSINYVSACAIDDLTRAGIAGEPVTVKGLSGTQEQVCS